MKLDDVLFTWLPIIVIFCWLANKVISFVKMFFTKLPDWHNKHGKEYIKWKSKNN